MLASLNVMINTATMVTSQSNLKYVRYIVDVHFGYLQEKKVFLRRLDGVDQRSLKSLALYYNYNYFYSTWKHRRVSCPTGALFTTFSVLSLFSLPSLISLPSLFSLLSLFSLDHTFDVRKSLSRHVLHLYVLVQCYECIPNSTKSLSCV